MDTLMALIGPYYSLDWITMLIGTSASYLFSSHKLRAGFMLGILACSGALIVAYLSHQTGFIVYNALLISINIRGLINGDRRKKTGAEAPVMEIMQPSEAVPVRVHAR